MPSVELLFGPMLIGVYLNCILYGIMLMQSFVYYQTYKRDALWIRCFVLYLVVVETANTCLDIGMMYEPLIFEFSKPAATTFFPILLAADPIVTVAISTPIQIFIAWRISIISQSKLLAALIIVLALVAFSGGVWTTITVTVVKRFAKKPELHWPALLWLLASAIADLVITTSLTLSLSRRRTGIRSTDTIINRIIRLTIQTGLVTAIFASLDVICFLTVPHSTLNFVWDFSLSKLYTNALLSTLNARAGWNVNAPSHNLLFGGQRSTESRARSSRDMFATGPNMSFFPVSTQLRSGTFELEPAHSPTIDSVEYGVAITKEIEIEVSEAPVSPDSSPPRPHALTTQ